MFDPALSVQKDEQGCAKPIEHTKQEEAVDTTRYPRTDLDRLSTKERALVKRIKDPNVPAEERARAQLRLDLTRQEIDSLRRCAQMAVTAG